MNYDEVFQARISIPDANRFSLQYMAYGSALNGGQHHVNLTTIYGQQVAALASKTIITSLASGDTG